MAHAARPTVVREPLRLAYVRTIVTVEDCSRMERPANDVAVEEGRFWVISASNPFGTEAGDKENAARHGALLERLTELGYALRPAWGRAPDGSWSERSVAVFGIGRRRARALGRQADQNAVFEIAPAEQRVLGCFGPWVRARPHDPAWRPEPYSDLDLGEAVHDALGVRLFASFWRFRQPGWRVDGDTSLSCEECGGSLHLASALLCSKAGEWYDAKAILCQSCETAKLPSHLSKDLREAVYLWSDWRLAASDAVAQKKPGHRRCYVVHLEDRTGAKLSRDIEWVYVGETGKDVEDRFLEHLLGTHASPVVKQHGARLRWDLMEDLPVHGSVEESRAYEAYLAARLRLEGYGVRGGH